jgi:hypothetical protein
MKDSEDSNPSYRVTDADHKSFVELVLLPACRQAFDTSVVPVPLSFEAAGYYGLNKSVPIRRAELDCLVDAMRRVLDGNQVLSDIFGDFFFVTWCYGVKARFGLGCTYEDALNDFGFEWDQVNPQNLFLEVGVNFSAPAPGLTGLWHTGGASSFDNVLDQVLAADVPRNASAYRHDSFAHFKDLGGFKFSTKRGHIHMVQAYGHCKTPFYNRSMTSNRHSFEFEAADVFHGKAQYPKFVVSLTNNALICSLHCVLDQDARLDDKDEGRVFWRSFGVWLCCL